MRPGPRVDAGPMPRSLRVKRREQPLVRVEDERVGLFQRPWYLGRGSGKMPEPPYAPLTFVSENVLTAHDLFARHHDLLLRLTAFACIRYFRHQLFVDAQSLVFKLLFPFCLPGSNSSIEAKRKVRDIPIATGFRAVRFELVLHCSGSSRRFRRTNPRPTWMNCSGQAGASRPDAEHGRPSVAMRRYR